MSSERTTITLTEYKPALFAKSAIPESVGEALWRNYNSQVSVEFPSPKTGNQWQLTPNGWVGYLPVTPEFGVWLQPRVELSSLFAMLEYAYRLKSFELLDGLVSCDSLDAFYERIAGILARRVLDRARKGFHRAYVGEAEQLSFLKGRLNARRTSCAPWDVKLHCEYEEHTPDIEDNQILAWTLSRIARSPLAGDRVMPTVRRAYHAIAGAVSVKQFKPNDCVDRIYQRLNDDYQPLHALCRFFLEHSGPTHRVGDHTMLPFMVDMARLFELFVAEWLKVHLPDGWSVEAQERVHLTSNKSLYFDMDLVLSGPGGVMCVLDTKYKVAPKPSSDDIAQVIAYAQARGCSDAILVYPMPLAESLDEQIGQVRVRTAVFDLRHDLAKAGAAFRSSFIFT